MSAPTSDDIETVNLAATPGARGVVLHTAITAPSNYRATRHLDQWLKSRGVIGLAGIDTRALTALIREKGMPNAVIAHEPSGHFDLDVAQGRGAAMAGPRRHGPRADGDDGAALHLERDAVAVGQRATASWAGRNSTSSPSTTASSATFCASSPAMAAR